MNFLLSRLVFYFTEFGVAITVNFLLPRMMPGDPFTIMFAAAQEQMQPEQIEVLKAQFGFVSGPLFEQYWSYLKSIFSGDLGPSLYRFPTPVTEVIGTALLWTLLLAGTSVLISMTLGTFMDAYAAYHCGRWFDSIFSPSLLVLGAFPAVVVAMLAYHVFGLELEWFPVSNGYNPDLDPGWTFEFVASVAYHAVLPILSMVVVSLGGWLFGMRNSTINLLGEDFITMARAKGLSNSRS